MNMMGKKKNKRKSREEEHEPFREGSLVEVTSNEEGFKGSWFEAKILKSPPFSKNRRKGKALVEYTSLLSEDQFTPLTETVDVSFIRPLPPQDTNHSFEPYDVVDANYCGGWWKGVVTKTTALSSYRSYSVVFDDPPDEMELRSSDLRLHFDWSNGKWVKPGKQKRMKGLKFSPGTAVEVNRNEGYSHDIWFPATVLEEAGFNSFLVKYNDSGIVDDSDMMEETVDSFNIRPAPPKSRVKRFDILEKVGAFCDLGWRAGFITKILTDERYIVQLKHEKEERKFSHSEIRPRMHLLNGRWVTSSKDRSSSSSSQEVTNTTNNVENQHEATTFGISDAAEDHIEPRNQGVNSRMILADQSTPCSEISDSKKVNQRESNSQATLSCSSNRFKMEDLANPINLPVCPIMSVPIEMTEQEIDGSAQVPAESESSFVGKNTEINQDEFALKVERVISTVEREKLPESSVESPQLSDAGLVDTTEGDSIEDVEVEHVAKTKDSSSILAVGTRGTCHRAICQHPDAVFLKLIWDLKSKGDTIQQQKGEEDVPIQGCATEMDFESCVAKEDELLGNIGVEPAGHCPGSPVNQLNDASGSHPETMMQSCAVNVPVNSQVANLATAQGFCCSSNYGQFLPFCSEGHTPDSPVIQLNDATERQLETVMQSPQLNVLVNSQVTNVAMGETFYCASGDGQQLPLCSKGHTPGSPVNLLNNASKGQLETVMQSLVNVPSNSQLPKVAMAQTSGCSFSNGHCHGSPVNKLTNISKRQLETVMQSPVANVLVNSQVANVAMAETFCCFSGDCQPLPLCSKGHRPGSPVNQSNKVSKGQLETVLQSPVVDDTVHSQLPKVATGETFCCSSGDEQPLPLYSEGHSPGSPVNQFTVISERQLETGMQSSVLKAPVNSQLLENVDSPFKKNSPIWKNVESLEIFQVMPQRPHFHPLVRCKELSREGLALGHTVNFASLVDKTSKLQVDDPRHVIQSYLDILAELEMLGFDVQAVLNRLNKLLFIKDEKEQLQDQSKDIETQLAECSTEKTKLDEEIRAIDEKILMLKKKQALNALMKIAKVSLMTSLESDASVIDEELLKAEQVFKSLAAAAWSA